MCDSLLPSAIPHMTAKMGKVKGALQNESATSLGRELLRRWAILDEMSPLHMRCFSRVPPTHIRDTSEDISEYHPNRIRYICILLFLGLKYEFNIHTHIREQF